MKITLRPTAEIVILNGRPVRCWSGETEDGIEVHAFIALLAVPATGDQSSFETALQTCLVEIDGMPAGRPN